MGRPRDALVEEGTFELAEVMRTNDRKILS
jgi:hypothetical protein